MDDGDTEAIEQNYRKKIEDSIEERSGKKQWEQLISLSREETQVQKMKRKKKLTSNGFLQR